MAALTFSRHRTTDMLHCFSTKGQEMVAKFNRNRIISSAALPGLGGSNSLSLITSSLVRMISICGIYRQDI